MALCGNDGLPPANDLEVTRIAAMESVSLHEQIKS